MFIQIEVTPNPNGLKFIPGNNVTDGRVLSFNKGADCRISPLTGILFEIDGVDSVLLGPDFITVVKNSDTDWEALKPEILITMMDYFITGNEALLQETSIEENANDSDVVRQIKEIIETRVRPAVAQDGGDIVYRNFENGVLFLELRGACSGCPSATITLKEGIESMMRHYVPEVQSVESV